MVEGKSRRAYNSAQRAEQARLTRRNVLEAAATSFEQRGYAGTTMQAVADLSGVSVGTVELLFGRKVAVFKAVIDVSIAGDDEPVAMLDRPWAQQAAAAPDAETLLARFAEQLRPSLHRSARLVHAAFEAAALEPELAELADQLARNRRVVATWLVDALSRHAPIRTGITRSDAVDTVWLLMEPASYLRVAQHRGWTDRRFSRWFARTVLHSLTAGER